MRYLAAAFVLLSACGAGSVPHVTAPDLARAQAKDPTVTQASLDKGRSLYLARCTSCHQPFAPASRTVAAWEHDLQEMRGVAGVGDDEAALILAYLRTFARPEL